MEPASEEISRGVDWLWRLLKRFHEENGITGADFDAMEGQFPIYWKRIQACERDIDEERDLTSNRAACLLYVETWVKLVTEYLNERITG